MFKHKGVHQCTWHQDTLGRRSMIDFVVVSSDLRPYVLDTRVKRGAELSTDHHLVVSWIRWQRRKLDRPGRPKRVLFRGRLGTLSPSGPCSLPPLSTLAVRSCGRKVSGACRGGNPPNPVVDTGSKGCRQAEEGVLSDHVGLWDSWTQLTGTGRPSKPQPGRSWRQKLGSGRSSDEAMEEDYRSASKRFWQTVRHLRRGKQYSANTVYSAGGELLTSTEDIVGRWKKYFEDLLNPTDLPSSEEAGGWGL
ncbi:hypothetical protein L3Q82_011166 [Scortum barcoo]|uniref:Uncharacterized protein n=1 Tax=Scortum barcoo TaxID=214431 RepID=A0ACB8W973_9TELE|nr:hypothetical protein L3Q82_011166 [Scortum barcoo]